MMSAALPPPGSAWADCIQFTTGGLSNPPARLPGVARSQIRGFACCNELYEHLPVVEGFRALRSIGYDAVEVAPYTFVNSVGLALMRAVGHPRFRLNLDTGVLTDEGRPPAKVPRRDSGEIVSQVVSKF
jgi:hypothetical protein